jgi:hypothetical protein
MIFSCGVWLKYSSYCLNCMKGFCLSRLPFSWSLGLRGSICWGVVLIVPIGVFGVLASSDPSLGYIRQKKKTLLELTTKLFHGLSVFSWSAFSPP